MPSRSIRIGWATVALLLLVVLTACSHGAIGRGDPGPPVAPATGASASNGGNAVDASNCDPLPLSGSVPSFTGPWAAELDSAYHKACAQVDRDILADGVISAAEIQELTAQYTQCLVNLGFTNVHMNPDGSGSMTAPAGKNMSEMESSAQPCRCATGWFIVGPLYQGMRGNPQNIDIPTIMAECLVRVGVVPAGYTAAKYMADGDSGLFNQPDWYPSTPKGQALAACNADPAHAK